VLKARDRWRADRQRYNRRAWVRDRTIYAVAWLRVGQAIDELPAGKLRSALRQVHGFGSMAVVILTGVEIARGAQIGSGLRLIHGQGIVISPAVVIGSNASILHGVTLGDRRGGDAPTLGDDVELGAYCAVLGNVVVGDGVHVGAHAVVLHDVPDQANVAGNPARILFGFRHQSSS
jgi:serine O-acetyltransferase